MATTVPMPLLKGVCQIYYKLYFSKKKAHLKFATSETYCRLSVTFMVIIKDFYFQCSSPLLQGMLEVQKKN